MHDFTELVNFTAMHPHLEILKIEYAPTTDIVWNCAYNARGNRYSPKTFTRATRAQNSVRHLSMGLTLMSWQQVNCLMLSDENANGC